MDWIDSLEVTPQNDGFVRYLFSEEPYLPLPFSELWQESCHIKLSLRIFARGGREEQIMGRTRYFQNSLQPGKIVFQSV